MSRSPFSRLCFTRFSVPPEQSGFAWSVFVSGESVYSYFGAQNSKVHLILRYFQWKSNRLFSDTYFFRHILLLTRDTFFI